LSKGRSGEIFAAGLGSDQNLLIGDMRRRRFLRKGALFCEGCSPFAWNWIWFIADFLWKLFRSARREAEIMA